MNLLLGIGIGVVLLLLLVYLYLKENDNNKRQRRYERAIEELNKEVYRLQKRIKEQENELERSKSALKAQMIKDTRLEIKNLLDANLNAQIMPIKMDMESIKREFQEAKAHLQDVQKLEGKVYHLEDRLKEFVYTPSNPTNIDEGRIISMFKDGWSVDSIAKELRIGKGEVEFTLKFANLN